MATHERPSDPRRAGDAIFGRHRNLLERPGLGALCLSKEPHVEAALHEEIERVLAGRIPGVEDLAALPYLEKFFKELLRLYPTVYNIGRIAIGDCELGGVQVRRGVNILLSQWSIHRSSKHYAEPERFMPERWTAEMTSQLHKFAYLPFGAGPRVCIGAQFGLVEAKIILVGIVRRFRLSSRPTLSSLPIPRYAAAGSRAADGFDCKKPTSFLANR